MIGLAAGMEMADMAWEVKCREEDMKQRALENERHAIDDARRAVDEKAQQLQVLANQGALFAGFSMVVLVESSIPDAMNGVLLTVFGAAVAITIALFLVSTLNSTYILVAILRYDCVRRDVPFSDFWRKRCEPDWKIALRTFSYGVPSFLMVVSLVAWVTFWEADNFVVSASVVTAISTAVTLFWFGRTDRKWRDFLLMPEARVLTRGLSVAYVRRNGGGTMGVPSPTESCDYSASSIKVDDLRMSLNGSDDNSMNLSSLAIGELSESDQKLDNKKDASTKRTTGKKVMGAVRFGSN